jgi:4-amino-4-deoxy-L-arabinose transferase-like glycosyltransferase
LKLKTAWPALGLLFILFGLLLDGQRRVYLTADEPAYIAGGYALWARGAAALPFLAQRGYPPLLAGLEGWGPYAANPHVPVTQLAGWPDNFDTFISAFAPYFAPMERTLFAARLPTIWLTVLLGAMVYRWAKSLWGVSAGWLALAALTFDPTLLAHGRLAHTDAGIVALGTASLFTVWRWRNTLRWELALLGGLWLGLTLLAKVSGSFWLAAAGVTGLITLVERWHTPRRWRCVGQGGGMLGVCLVLFWGGYAFTWGYASELNASVPAPAYWDAIAYLRHYTSVIFALGRRWFEPVWWYYPLAFVVKNPLLLLAGVVVGLTALLRRPASWLRAVALWFFPVLYSIAAIIEGMDIGYRHMLPIHPYLYLIIGGGVTHWARAGRRWRGWVAAAASVAYAAGTLSVFPNEIAYFNELVGGPAGGYRYLADSNVDWGQTPPEVVNTFLQTHPGVQTVPPQTPFRPDAGQYIVSAAHLQGAGLSNPYAYEWFRHQKPVTSLNRVLLVYDAPPFEITWVGQCQTPAPPFDSETLLNGIGQIGFRLIELDCANAWLYPADGAGLYALNYDLFWPPQLEFPSMLFGPPLFGAPTPRDAFVARHLANARLSFEKSHKDPQPAFVLYESASPPVVPLAPFTMSVALAETPPGAIQNWAPLSGPVTFNPALRFLSFAFYPQGDVWEIETWWQVNAGPIDRPVSLMAHLVSADGFTLANADGLGVSPLALRPGDVFVQRHRFPKPLDGQAYWLRTGVYWADTLERWPIDDADALFILLAP